jgi:hypothetical protein
MFTLESKIQSLAATNSCIRFSFLIAQKKPKYPDFTNKRSDAALWLNTAPKSVLEKLDSLTFNSGYNAAKTYKPADYSMGKGYILT